MKSQILKLIKEEQARQKGDFIPNEISFLEKIFKRAELIKREENGKLIGYVFFYCNSEDKKFSYITLLAVDPKSQNCGIGKALVKQVLDTSKSRGYMNCRLEVKKTNKKAINFYKKLGFEPLEHRSKTILLSKPLGSK